MEEMHTKDKPQNLMDGLLSELERVRDVKTYYDEIPQGRFGSAMLQMAITNAENAIKENDIIKMVSAYKSLKECE